MHHLAHWRTIMTNGTGKHESTKKTGKKKSGKTTERKSPAKAWAAQAVRGKAQR
jgi:hypothetical protein